MRIDWRTETVKKAIGKRQDTSPAGELLVNPKTGKPRMVNITTDASFAYPVVVLAPGEDFFEQLPIALLTIAEAKVPGFETASQLLEHTNFGLYTDARNALARGADPRYTQAQRTLMRTLGNLAKAGLMTPEMCVQSLLMQGISDAESIISGYMSGDHDDDEGDEV